MIKIEAVIRPDKLDAVKAALDELGVNGITIQHVMGAGKQRGRTQYYRGQEYVVNILDKIKLEVIVIDSVAESAIKTIESSAGTGEIGDGKIFVTRIDDAIRIRTGERGDVALN
jgi:nitrogen regulatory protein P-II 1